MAESMLALTVWQPSLSEMRRPYLAGVLHGDGWCTALGLGLRVKDRDFADAFAAGLEAEFGRPFAPRLDERGYWLIRTSNKGGGFTHLRDFEPTNNDDLGWWLRGLFDSEGNAQLTPAPATKPNSFSRRIAIYSTNEGTLVRASVFMDWLGISNLIRPTNNSETHKGTKRVFELRVLRQDGFARFADMAGSNIRRKQSTIDRIVSTYQPAGWQGRNWAKAIDARWPRP